MKTELLKTEWYQDQMNKVQMATLHKITDNGNTYYIVNGDAHSQIGSFELANLVFLNSIK